MDRNQVENRAWGQSMLHPETSNWTDLELLNAFFIHKKQPEAAASL